MLTEERSSSTITVQDTMQSTLLPGWEKINLKEAKIEPKKDNSFVLIH